MHGRVKSEQKELTEEEKQYIIKAKQLFDECIKLMNEDQKKVIFSEKTLDLTEKVLKINSDIATMWNFRKSYIMHEQSNKEVIDQLLYKELAFTESLFKNDPKSYSLWSNRAWLLEFIVNFREADQNLVQVERDYLNGLSSFEDLSYTSSFKESLARHSSVKLKLLVNELELCNKLFKIDDRNFHCWRHRSFVLCCLRRVSVVSSWDSFVQEMQSQELDFLDRMIETNFSNYSAWHHRILLANGSRFDSMDDFKRESELVHTAMFTEPNDQSIWQYYFWLVGDFLPSLVFKNNPFEVNLSFYIKEFQVRLPENTDKGGRIELLFKFSLACLIGNSDSGLSVETGDGSRVTLEKGSWEPIYEDYASKYGFANSRLPTCFDNRRRKRTADWKYSISTGEIPAEEVESITNFLSGSPPVYFLASAVPSDTVYSKAPTWSLDDPEYYGETFSSLRICTRLSLEEYKSYSFTVCSKSNKTTCRYCFDSESQLKAFTDILQDEFELLKSIQELEPECKYPIIALKFVNDIYHLCSPPELADCEKMKIDLEILKQLPSLDPLRRLYYSEKLNIA